MPNKTGHYVDGFVAAVPAANKKAYLDHARETGAVFKEYGALEIVECWGDDVPEGTVTSFPMAVACNAGEVVVFSWITWPSKQARDEGMEKCMNDPRMRDADMPFDGQRMIFGGFEMALAL